MRTVLKYIEDMGLVFFEKCYCFLNLIFCIVFKNKTKLKTKRIFLFFLLLETKLVLKNFNQTLVLRFFKSIYCILILSIQKKMNSLLLYSTGC